MGGGGPMRGWTPIFKGQGCSLYLIGVRHPVLVLSCWCSAPKGPGQELLQRLLMGDKDCVLEFVPLRGEKHFKPHP